MGKLNHGVGIFQSEVGKFKVTPLLLLIAMRM